MDIQLHRKVSSLKLLWNQQLDWGIGYKNINQFCTGVVSFSQNPMIL